MVGKRSHILLFLTAIRELPEIAKQVRTNIVQKGQIAQILDLLCPSGNAVVWVTVNTRKNLEVRQL